MKRVLVLGGAGNFGARIVRALRDEAGIDLVVAGRSVPARASGDLTRVSLDIRRESFPSELQALAPQLVIHCVGPFQGQDYRVACAALTAGAHYIDLADGRDFVAGFAESIDPLARSAGRAAISGASTLPALSCAVIDHLAVKFASLEAIEVAIAPGQRAPRGVATLQAVFSYLGRPIQVWEDGRWRRRTGWMNLRRIPLAFGDRWGALCDVPDLALLPERYTTVRTVRFHAALEFRVQHAFLWLLAGARRLGIPVPMTRWSAVLHHSAGWFDRFAGPSGGMRVSVVGVMADGSRARATWQLTAPAMDGPEIPCMASILLARRLLCGEPIEPGARACMGILPLEEFTPEFDRWRMTTAIQEEHP